MTLFANPVWRAYPRVKVDLRHPITQAQSAWYSASSFGRSTPRNLMPYGQGQFPGAIGISVDGGGATPFGPAWRGSGTNNLDLGVNNRFIASDTQPFTISWIEQHDNVVAAPGIVNLIPGGGSTTPFAILRASQTSLDASHYGAISVGPWKSGGQLVGWLSNADGAPPLVSTKALAVFVIVGRGGPISQTASDWTLYCGGYAKNLSGATGAASGNTGAFGATQNWFGWDNVDSKFSGLLDNLRIWNRALTPAEARAVCLDPLIGAFRFAPRRSNIYTTFKPWTHLPTGFPP